MEELSEMISKTKRTIIPIFLGWILTVWLPVPYLLNRTISTAAAAVVNGCHAIVSTIEGSIGEMEKAPQQHADASRRK